MAFFERRFPRAPHANRERRLIPSPGEGGAEGGEVAVDRPVAVGVRLRGVLAGDAEAIGWLYDTFAPRLLRRLRQRFGSLPGLDPEDLLQDTYVYLLDRDGHALRRFSDRAEPSAADLERFMWSAACGIVSNRKRSLSRRPSSQVEQERQLGSSRGDETPAVARDALRRLGDCLRRGGQRFFLYFQLRYVDGLRPAEIVEVTGWSKKKTYKLKQALDHALDQCAEELDLGR